MFAALAQGRPARSGITINLDWRTGGESNSKKRRRCWICSTIAGQRPRRRQRSSKLTCVASRVDGGFVSWHRCQPVHKTLDYLMSGSSDSRRSLVAGPFAVYIVRCSDGSLYVGHSANVEDRVKAHNDGRGAAWTACRRPVELVYQETFKTEQEAVARERQLKRWTHGKKLALINGDAGTLTDLATRRIR
jgi:putative endonuclease